MPTYVRRPGHPHANSNGMVDKTLLYADYVVGSAPGVISDTMDATRHMADGKLYTSKSAFRAATKAAGCVEVGNETPTLLKPRKPIPLDRGARREAIQRAVYELKNGRRS